MKEAKAVKQLGPDCFITHIKTKKIAMVSSREQFLCLTSRSQEADQSKSGKREFCISGKSKELPEFAHLSDPSAVRGNAVLNGFLFIETSPTQCECHFYLESDFKISLFIAK